MAVIAMDSFDHYTTLADKGWVNASNATIQAASGRFGTSGLRVTQAGSVDKLLGANYVSGRVGHSFKFTVYPTTLADLIRLRDAATTHISVAITNGGLLRLYRGGSGGTLLGTGTTVLLPNTEYYIETGFLIDDATGVAIVRINGITELNLTSQDTRNGANASIERITPCVDTWVSGAQGHYDDFYFLDLTGGAPNNDFLGDVRAEMRLPNGNGNSSQFDGSDGNQVDNYLLVDETPPDSDTTYVESPDVNDKDTYTYQDVTPTAGNVYAVQINPFAKKTDAGGRSIKSVARLSGTETNGPEKSLGTTYSYHSDIRETKPGGGAWTLADVNNAEFGQMVFA